MPEDVIPLADAARLLTVAPCTLWRRLRDGRLRGWRLAGGRWKVSRGEALSLVTMNAPRPEVVARADRARELEEVDRILRREGVRR
jgi:hypothetical protein